jgi:hypothetical protein
LSKGGWSTRDADRDVGIGLIDRQHLARRPPRHVELSAQHARDVRRLLGQIDEAQLIKMGRAAPIAVEARQRDVAARHELLEAERAAAGGVAHQVAHVARRDLGLEAAADHLGELGERPVQGETDDMAVDLLDFLDHREHGAGGRGGLGVADALEAVDHVVGIDLAAVMEFCALAQEERPHPAVGRGLPALGQLRLGGQGVIGVDQIVVDRAQQRPFLGAGRRMGVELVGRADIGDRHLAAALGRLRHRRTWKPEAERRGTRRHAELPARHAEIDLGHAFLHLFR